jgi:hypothetical protein
MIIHFFLSLYYNTLKKNSSKTSLNKFYFDVNNKSPISDNQKNLQDIRKCNYFSKLGIDQSQHQALKYISIGIAEHSDLFIDMSLIKFIANNHLNVNCYSLLLKLLSLFPFESRLLNLLYNRTLSFPNLGFLERFLLYQVYQIKCLRQSSGSSEIGLKLAEMKVRVRRGINFSRKFWLNPNVKISFLSQIKNYTVNLNAIYQEIADFLIECATDFINGLKIKHKIN